MTWNRRTESKSGMLAFDEEAGRKLEAIYLTDDAAARRRALRGALHLQPGEYGLYIGSGPGLAPCEIAQALGPAGRLAVVEKNAAMLAMTERRAARDGLLDGLDLRQGDATALPFPDDTFAFVGSAQVFEYVPDVARAVSEAYRVLRPGGRLALINTDWQTLIWDTDDAHLGARVATAWEGHLAHNHLPRRLEPLLSRTGFQVERVEPIVILNTGYDPNAFSFMLLHIVADYVRGTGQLSPDEVDGSRDTSVSGQTSRQRLPTGGDESDETPAVLVQYRPRPRAYQRPSRPFAVAAGILADLPHRYRQPY